MSPPPGDDVGRGARKLRAAIEAFDLGGRIRGADALDIGAGTGGFTQVLLAHGARHVTALDVGTGQLAPVLATDPRVTLLEHVHIRTAPRRIAPGPFAFFTVDVSFLSARTTLRPLSLRLASGAEGVVLLKPGYELPRALVPRGGVVTSRNLRKLAFNRFRPRARERGFEILSKITSPVPGGDGSIELLLHLRFDPSTIADRRPVETSARTP